MSKKAGTNATTPLQIPLRGWWQIGKRLVVKVQRDNLSLIAAGVAFYFLLAIFPLLAALISLYGLFVDSAQLTQHMQVVVSIFPNDSHYIIEDQIHKLISKSDITLSTGFALSLTLALYSGGKGAQALVTACNITYQEDHGRGFLRGIFVRVILTLCMVLSVIFALSLMSILPSVIRYLSGFDLSKSQAKWITWPLMLLLFNVVLSALYRYGPVRSNAKWRWVTPGSLFASVTWVVVSAGFSYYLSQFAKYNETYGSIGGIVILLMWFYLSAYAILLGAELNSATEIQTHKDSTTGNPKPMGARGAKVADTTSFNRQHTDPVVTKSSVDSNKE